MVVPVQSSTGNSTIDNEYLNELRLFYSKAENEGKKTDYVAPNGQKFHIEDASYLSRVQSNFNSGKLDDKNKTVSDKADMNLDDSEYSKNKKAGKNKKDMFSDDVQKSASGKISSAKQSRNSSGKSKEKTLSIKEGQGTVQGVNTAPDKIASTSAPVVAAEDDANQKAEQVTKETQKKLKEQQKEAKKDDKKLEATTSKNTKEFKSALSRLEAKIQSKAQEPAPKEAAAEAEAQSGSKMGFGGKLMTTSSGLSSTDATWQKTMEGPTLKISQEFQKQQAKLADVKKAGEKAAAAFNKQAAATDLAAAKKLEDAKTANSQASAAYTGAAVNAVKGTVQLVTGIASATQGTTEITTGVPLMSQPFTLPEGTVLVVKSTGSFMKSVASFVGAAGSYMSAVTGAQTGAAFTKQSKELKKEKAELDALAEQQRVDGQIARKQVIAQTNMTNAKTIQATQQVNKMLATLGNSSLPAVSVENEEELEAVKEERYEQIMAHEQKHAAVIGGTPVIITDSQGVAIGGYVEIDIPTLDKNDLQGTVEKAQKVIDAALAPSDPSSQDITVANQAKSVLGQAQDLLEEKVKKGEDPKNEKSKSKK